VPDHAACATPAPANAIITTRTAPTAALRALPPITRHPHARRFKGRLHRRTWGREAHRYFPTARCVVLRSLDRLSARARAGRDGASGRPAGGWTPRPAPGPRFLIESQTLNSARNVRITINPSMP